MRIFFAFAFIFTCSISFAQYNYQNANSIVLNSNYKKNEFSAEASFEFNHFQFTGIYNVSKKVFLHSNLKLNVLQQRADKFFSGFLGGKPVILHNNDVGFGYGLGLQNVGRIGKLNMQVIFGYDYEKQNYRFNETLANANSSYVDSVIKQNNALYKISSNLNLTRIDDKCNVSYLMRISYCKFTKYQYNKAVLIKTKGFAIFEPTVNLDFKLLKNKNLFIVTQCGFSLPLSSTKYLYNTNFPPERNYLLDIILKLGLKYNFIKK